MKKPRKPRTKKSDLTLIQTNLKPELAKRFYASPEFKLLGNVSSALRAMLDNYLPQLDQEGQEKNGTDSSHQAA